MSLHYLAIGTGALAVLGCIGWALLPDIYKSMVPALYGLVYALIQVKIHNALHLGKQFSFIDEFESIVDNNSSRLQFLSVDDGKCLTLGEVDTLSNQIAWWLASNGLNQKDTVALMMLNRPEYPTFWIGSNKIGVISSLINTNSTGKTLVHSVTLSLQDTSNKILVVDSELKNQIAGDVEELKSKGVKIFYWDEEFVNGVIKINRPIRPSKAFRSSIAERDPVMYIFTSGTTGLPKATKITHSKLIVASWPYTVLANLTSEDRIYNTMPLYHSSAGLLGITASLRSGACMVMRKKFSVKSYAHDCVKYNCTSILYIGELCRYLLTGPISEYESKMNIKTAFGNGMRPEVWSKFKERYHIGKIVEFYASTEGNLALFNSTNKVGALGFIPRWADILYPVTLVRADPDDQSIPYRNAQGRCEKCEPNEVGLLISPIDDKRVDRRFDGYTDSAASAKKILRGVFHKNDAFFNTGDLLSRDEIGFYFWSDRVGDTFRWKGENVSTSEVGEVLSHCSQIADVTVYGVAVPGCDGRAGMAAITLINNVDVSKIDWNEITSSLSMNLPVYARPYFFRIQREIETTGTFKHLKGPLVKEGFHPAEVKGDPLFYHSPKDKTVVPLTLEVHADIASGKIQF